MNLGRKRVVFDTSTLVAVLLYPERIPAQAFRLAASEFEVCASSDTLIELVEVLKHDKFNQWRPIAERSDFVERYMLMTKRIGNIPPVADCRDPKDDKFLALALESGADYIISSDEDLLILNPYQGIPVIRPLDFLERCA